MKKEPVEKDPKDDLDFAIDQLREMTLLADEVFMRGRLVLSVFDIDITKDPRYLSLRKNLKQAVTIVHESGDNPFRQLKIALRYDNVQTLYPIGTEIPDRWTDTAIGETYDMPWTVAHYGKMHCADDKEHSGVILLRQTVPPFDVQFDAAEPDNPDGRRKLCGNIRYALSNLAQWQNSCQKAGEWFVPQHEHDAPPEFAQTKDGYLCGCSPELLEVLDEQSPIQLTSIIAYNPGDSITDCFTGHVFSPAIENISASNIPEEFWELFQNTYKNGRRKPQVYRDAYGNARNVWLRSHYLGSSICYMDVDGVLCSCSPSNSCGFLACVFIYAD